MSRLVLVAVLASIMGCGEAPPPPPTPEQEAKMKAEMDKGMADMMSGMKATAPPGTPKPKN